MYGQHLLTYSEAAGFLRISKSTLYHLVSKGRIPIVQLGTGRGGRGTTRLRRQDLEDYIESQTVRRDGRPKRLQQKV